MNKKFTFIILIILVIIGFIVLLFDIKIITLNPKTQKATSLSIVEETPTIQPKKEEPKIIKDLNCPQPKKEYEDYSYLNVGQEVAIPDKSYIPSDLVLLDKDLTTVPVCLKKEAADALTEMLTTAKEDGYSIKVSSGFREYETQKIIFARNIKENNKDSSVSVAKPGYSEHQLGMAVDLTGSSVNNASATIKFKDTPEDTWLEKNSHLYGFVQSYPEDKKGTTGYMYEAWHYRYVGIDNAKEITKNDQTINEFLKAVQESYKKIKSTL